MSFDWTSNPQLALKKKKGTSGAAQQTTGGDQGVPGPSLIAPAPEMTPAAASASGGLPPESVGILANPLAPAIPDPGALDPATGQAIGGTPMAPPMVEAAPIDLAAAAPASGVMADPLAKWQARNPATALSAVPFQTPLARAAAGAKSRINQRQDEFNRRMPRR